MKNCQENLLFVYQSIKVPDIKYKDLRVSFKKSVIFFISFWVLSPVFASPTLSDQLPTSLVRELINLGVWKDSFDEAGNGEGEDLKVFWSIVNSDSTSHAHIVRGENSLRGTMETEEIVSHYPELYRIKIFFLRYARNSNKRAAVAIHNRWSQTYEELALKVIKFSGIQEYTSLIDSYNRLKGASEIKFKDLDPNYREELSRFDRNSHDLSITDIDSQTSLYKVNGVYNSKLKVFAVDLSRSINETLITFAHEIVHAADPEIARYREEVKRLYPRVLSIIYGWMGTTQLESESIAKDLLNHVLYETNSVDVITQLRDIRQRRIQRLDQQIEETPSTFEPTSDELGILEQFFTAVIGQTVINEYRAYGLSLALYLKLKDDKNLIPPSRERRQFIEQFMSGDEVFAVNLANDFNPFKSYQSPKFAALIARIAQKNIVDLATDANVELSDEVKLEMSEEEVGNVEIRKKRAIDTLNFIKSMHILERNYLSSLEKILLSLNNRFSRYFKDIKANISSDVLPPWARPGGMSHQLHPYQILTARLTTAWVIRFRRNLQLIHSEIKELTSPLFNMRLGILDLSDVSDGERELIGIKYSNRVDGSPVTLPEELKIGVSEIPREIKAYFQRVEYRLDPSTYRSNPILRSEVVKNLLKLRLLKALVWIDKSFLNWEATLVQSFNFLELLDTGNYDKSQMSIERATELKEELKQGLLLSQDSRDEFDLMVYLLATLGDVYRIADQNEWSKLYETFFRKRNVITSSLEQFALYNNISKDQFTSLLREEQREFEKTIERSDFQKACNRDWRRSRRNKAAITFYSSGNYVLDIRGNQFPFSMICNQRKLYIVRQPGDVLRSMTSLYERHNGIEGVTIRVFNGTRPILLD